MVFGGTRLRYLTAGESHGPSLTGILEGMPAGLRLESAQIDRELARRQRGLGAGGRMKIERDHARVTSGVMAGATTGGPIAVVIENLDYGSWAGRDVEPMTVPRPGHADLTGSVKYGYGELRLSLERASARETAMRVAMGAVARALLLEFGVVVGGYVVRIGEAALEMGEASIDPAVYAGRFARALESDVGCPDAAAAARMREAIEGAAAARDTVGGVIEVAALHVPPGLGSYVQHDRRLDARLAGALVGLPAVKAFEIGDGFAGVRAPGTRAHDEIEVTGKTLTRRTNRAGGLEGGISNGGPIVVRVALKPIATTLTPLRSVDLATGAPAPTHYERSDICQVPRAVPIAEAAVCLVLADALLEKLGGDSIAEMRPRFAALRRMELSDLPMDARPWRFGYEL